MRRILFAVLMSFVCLGIYARPARVGKIAMTQPDGTRFYAVFSGDEYVKIKMTETGESIIQDADGWWCYAVYDSSGRKTSTGYHVGSSAPVNVLESSRNVPYDVLSDRAAAAKRKVQYNRLNRSVAPYRLQAVADQSDKAGLIILAQFKDAEEKFKMDKSDFVAMLTQTGYSVNGATGSAKEYFDSQFGGKCNFSFDVTDIVTVNQNRAYYGGNDNNGDDQRPHELIIEACRLVDGSVDFSRYDQDNDGEVDNVFVFFAGLDEAAGAPEDHIWAHAWYIRDGAGYDLNLDGVVINRYACASELEGESYNRSYMTGIGTFCHEYSHTLGLPDFYDADYENGNFAAALWGATSLMDSGNYNNNGNTPPYYNAMEREVMALSSPTVITGPGSYELGPIYTGQYYRLNTSIDDEYFLIEYRDGTGWDGYAGGEGVLVYHVDKSSNPAGYSWLYERDVTAAFRWNSQVDINALASRQCADLLEADGRKDQFVSYQDPSYINLKKSLAGLFFPYRNVMSLTPKSSPGLVGWGNASVEYAITDISIKDGKAAFNVVNYSENALPTAVNIVKDVFQDGAIISFESSFSFNGKAVVSYSVGNQTFSSEASSFESGRWAFEITGIAPMTSCVVNIAFSDGGVQGEAVKTTFMTKTQSFDYPYIYMENVDVNRLPLKVFNAEGAEEIQWKFNGVQISRDKDFYYRPKSSGTLTAYVYWTDGSMDVIIKEIKLTDE